jgi:hypothetical protein
MNRRTNRTVHFTVFLLLVLLIAAPLPAADEMKVVESETGFYYTIQKGDTLWDLSNQFSDSPWLWPELWKENDQISNPHWIFPGERIRLYKKKGSQTIAKTQPAASAVEPVEPTPQPTLEKAAAPYFLYSAIDSIGFIRKPPVAPSGTIFEVKGRKTLIGEGDIVYIQPAEDAPHGLLIPGSKHTIFRYMKPTDEKHSLETIGTQHYILGIAEVIKKESEMVLARVVKSYRAIAVDDMLMPYGQRSAKIELRPSTPGIDGRIIISEDHTMLTGEYMLAFIDKGYADNIKVGQQYSVYRQEKTVLENNKISEKQLPPSDFGTFLVLHTEQNTSTVVVTDADTNINAGERFRTPIN